MSNVGKLFTDKTAAGTLYAVGRTGFIDLKSGDFIAYDSAFSSETFDHPAFVEIVVTNDVHAAT